MVVSKRCPAGETRKTRGGWKGDDHVREEPASKEVASQRRPRHATATQHATPAGLAPLRAKPWRIEALRRLNGLLTCLFYGAYVLLIAVVLLRGNPAALIALMAVPAAGFVLLSFVRKRLDRPRPYETCEGVQPLIARDGSGESFPEPPHILGLCHCHVVGGGVLGRCGRSAAGRLPRGGVPGAGRRAFSARRGGRRANWAGRGHPGRPGGCGALARLRVAGGTGGFWPRAVPPAGRSPTAASVVWADFAPIS